jgi:hypothetical protein
MLLIDSRSPVADGTHFLQPFSRLLLTSGLAFAGMGNCRTDLFLLRHKARFSGIVRMFSTDHLQPCLLNVPGRVLD